MTTPKTVLIVIPFVSKLRKKIDYYLVLENTFRSCKLKFRLTNIDRIRYKLYEPTRIKIVTVIVVKISPLVKLP